MKRRNGAREHRGDQASSVTMPNGHGEDGHDDLIAFFRLSADLKKAARELTVGQARYLVDTYYQIQQFRIEAANQARAGSTAQEPEPVAFVDWIAQGFQRLEASIKSALDAYSETTVVGRWAKSQDGIGPVIAAGLLAHVDITRCPTAGSLWRFAGLDITQEWLGKERGKKLAEEIWEEVDGDGEQAVGLAAARLSRKAETLLRHAQDKKTGRITPVTLSAALARQPHNARLKTLAWKIGESFVKVSGKPEAAYGQWYRERKAVEVAKNASGALAEQAQRALTQKHYRRETVAKQAYESGRLPDAHVHARAKRWTVKLFLSHYHHVAYAAHYGTPPPRPYAVSILGHGDHILPPKWPTS